MEEQLSVTVDLHNQGLHFGLFSQGTQLLALMLSDPIPRQQLNNSILLALRPLLATMGPWINGYGLMQDNMRIEIQVSVGAEGLRFTQVPQLQATPTLTIHELSDVDIANHSPTSTPHTPLMTADQEMNMVTLGFQTQISDQEMSAIAPDPLNQEWAITAPETQTTSTEPD